MPESAFYQFPEGKIWHEPWKNLLKVSVAGYIGMSDLLDHFEKKLPLAKETNLRIVNLVRLFHEGNTKLFSEGGVVVSSGDMYLASEITDIARFSTSPSRQSISIYPGTLSKLEVETAKVFRKPPQFYEEEMPLPIIYFLAQVLSKSMRQIKPDLGIVRITPSDVAVQSILELVRNRK